MSLPKNALNWFEIPVIDFDRARAFYAQLLDAPVPDISVGEHRLGILPYTEGEGVGGAICAGPGCVPSTIGTVVYLSGGDDLQVVLDRVVSAGGHVLTPKFLITPELGSCAYFQDSEGNRVGLYSRH